jgi:hypothetical protein
LIAVARLHSHPLPGLLRAITSLTRWGETYEDDLYKSTGDHEVEKSVTALKFVGEVPSDPTIDFAAKLEDLWSGEFDRLFELVGRPAAPSAQTVQVIKVIHDHLRRREWNLRGDLLSLLSTNLQTRPVGLGEESTWRACRLPEGLLPLLVQAASQ